MDLRLSTKRIIIFILPPFCLKAINILINYKRRKFNFKKWWMGLQQKEKLPANLICMVDYFIDSTSFKNSSKYWNWLNYINIKQIYDFGYENFKQTVSKNYFTWVDKLDSPYSRNLVSRLEKIKIDVPLKEIFKKHKLFSDEESVIYNLVTVMLLQYVIDKGGDKYLNLIEEPIIGNPPFLAYNERRISQDILNSILEFISISEATKIGNIKRIIEIGAGSGRTAFVLLSFLKDVKYVIVDLPPALFVSQEYLTNIFQNKKIFEFRHFSSFREIENEFNSSDIVFLMPDQINLLPDKIAELFIAVDCLHEMKTKQVKFYFDQADRLANQFYFKCWEKTRVPFDNIFHIENDYPVKTNWHEVYKKKCEVPSEYFEAFYNIRS